MKKMPLLVVVAVTSNCKFFIHVKTKQWPENKNNQQFGQASSYQQQNSGPNKKKVARTDKVILLAHK